MVKITPQPIIDKFGRASQDKIAEAIGVSRITAAEWLNGRPKSVRLEILAKFALACDVEPGAFFVMAACNGDTTP